MGIDLSEDGYIGVATPGVVYVLINGMKTERGEIKQGTRVRSTGMTTITKVEVMLISGSFQEEPDWSFHWKIESQSMLQYVFRN